MCSRIETYEQACCVQGYCVYWHIWSAAMGEVLSCEREPTNSQDSYAEAVKKDEVARPAQVLRPVRFWQYHLLEPKLCVGETYAAQNNFSKFS